MTGRAVGGAWLAVSLAAHVSLLAATQHDQPPPRRHRPPSFVRLTLSPEPQAAPEPPPRPPTPKPPSRRLVPPKPTVAKPEPRASEPPESPSAPTSESTGTTLVSENGGGFSAPPGSGDERAGVLQSTGASPGSGRAVPPPSRVVLPAPAAPSALPPSQLARKPTPPPLTALLARNYPPEARRIGLSGDATVRARIEPSGIVRSATTVSESSPGFGEACRRTLLASQWTPPLDRGGRTVATFISYRCKFRVSD